MQTYQQTRQDHHHDSIILDQYDTPIFNEGRRLVITPGYINLKGIGSKIHISVIEYDDNNQKQLLINPKLVSTDTKIIHIDKSQIIATQVGTTILKIEKKGLSDSIRIDIKE